MATASHRSEELSVHAAQKRAEFNLLFSFGLGQAPYNATISTIVCSLLGEEAACCLNTDVLFCSKNAVITAVEPRHRPHSPNPRPLTLSIPVVFLPRSIVFICFTGFTGFRGGAKSSKGKFSSRQLSLRSFQQTVKNHANTINKASNVK